MKNIVEDEIITVFVFCLFGGKGKRYIRKIQKAVEVISRHIPLCIPFSLTSGIRELENNVNKKVIYALVMIVLFSESSRGVHGLPEGVGAADALTVWQVYTGKIFSLMDSINFENTCVCSCVGVGRHVS